MSEDELPFSKKDQRKLSAFLGNELLYDYLSRKLDPERMRAMDDVVAENREIQDEIQSLNSALNYVEHLAESDISESLLEQVRQPVSYLQGLLQKIQFHEWPRGFKLGLEAIFIVVMLVGGAIFFPWHYLAKWSWHPTQTVVLSELKNEFKESHQAEETGAAKEVSANASAEVKYQDDNSEKTVPPKSAELPKAPPASEPKKIKAVAANPTPALAESVVTAAPTVPVPTPTVEASKHTDELPVKAQGWLYRGNISVVNLDATTEKFIEKISELGGRKAGEVELGWKKAEGTYFHFTIPESKRQELEKYLSSYGQIKIQKDKHDRVMPDGIIRLIITVSESKKKSQ